MRSSLATPREADVLALHEIGWTRQDIADQLNVSVNAVRCRRRRAKQRAHFGVSRDALRKRARRQSEKHDETT
jgi:DNA-binding NarL/FixJ family response regulator